MILTVYLTYFFSCTGLPPRIDDFGHGSNYRLYICSLYIALNELSYMSVYSKLKYWAGGHFNEGAVSLCTEFDFAIHRQSAWYNFTVTHTASNN